MAQYFQNPAPLNLDAIMSGQPTTPWAARNRQQVRALLKAEGLPDDIVDLGAFDGMNIRDAALWVNEHRGEIETAAQTLADKQTALQMLGREVGDLPEDLKKRFLEDTGTTNVGSRLNDLRSEAMNRNSFQRAGYLEEQKKIAAGEAARRGQPVTAGDLGEIATRGATIYGRQLGSDLANLQSVLEPGRQAALGGLTNILMNYPQTTEDMPTIPAYQGVRVKIGKRITVPANYGQRNAYGIRFTNSGGESYYGPNYAGSY